MKKKLLLMATLSCLALLRAKAPEKNGCKPAKPQAVEQKAPEYASSTQRTFAIIKPDAVAAHHIGDIIKLIELNGFDLVRLKKVQLTRKQAELFYAEHKDKPFFKELVDYMTSGPVVLLALEREDAIKQWRDLMGATNPKNAAAGTLRRMFGSSITKNATHGSDSEKSAQRELNFFFPELQYS